MSDTESSSGLQWVHSTTAKVPIDQAARTRIRKQAMKQVAQERKLKGNYGKINLRQYPVVENIQSICDLLDRPVMPTCHKIQFGDANEMIRKRSGRSSPSQHLLVEYRSTNTIPTTFPSSGYEALTIKYGINSLDLSILTSVGMCRGSGDLLLKKTTPLVPLLEKKLDSFFSYLPARFGYNNCLSDATECTVARVRQLLSPSSHRLDVAVVSLYAKALKSLQTALNSAEQLDPEILCATEILALYELLNPSRESAWIQHSAGAANLIRLRGPDRYTTEFEKSLLMGHAGPIVTETLMKNDRCFLEQSAWQDVFRSLIISGDYVTERSEVVVTLVMLMSRLPGIFKDATDLICRFSDLDEKKISSLVLQADTLRQDLKEWESQHHPMLSRVQDVGPGDELFDKLCKILGFFSGCLIMCNRLIVALLPSSGTEIESESQEYAIKVFNIEKAARFVGVAPGVGLFLAHRFSIARATRNTRVEWWETIKTNGTHYGNGVRMVERWKFQRWCRLIGRQT